jgi:PAS domain S-box-containing protein
MLGIMLRSRHAMFMVWSPQYYCFYNDAYARSIGDDKHPRALAQPAAEVWTEIWDFLSPQLDDVVLRGRSSWYEDVRIRFWRNGRLEDAYWTYSYSPVFDGVGSIAAGLGVCTETTDRVLSARRVHLLQTLSSGLLTCKTPEQAIDMALTTFAASPEDVCAASFVRNAEPGAATMPLAASPSAEVRHPEQTPAAFPPEGTKTYCVTGAYRHAPLGHFTFAINPYLPFDAAYAGFLQHIVDAVSGAVEVVQSRRQADIFFNLPQRMLCLATFDGYLTRVSPAFCEALGYEEHYLLTQPYMQFVHPDDVPGSLNQVQRLVRHHNCINFINRYRCKDGTYRWLSWSAEPHDAVIYCCVHDITDLKEAQQQLVAAVNARDNFLGIASHELKTPLTSIKLYSQMIQRQFAQHGMAYFTRPKMAKFLQLSLMQFDRLGRLVDDMLDISRIAAGRLAIRLAETDLSALVHDTLARFELQFQAARCSVECSIEPHVHGALDAFRIEQVLNNLLTNAVRFAPGRPVRLSLRHKRAQAILSVTDHGPGIPPEHQERIFERFERFISPNEVSGLGLGLYIAKQIVEAHGGRIALHSTLGEGAAFTVILPLQLTEPPA